jgi:hypothetical protein
MAAFKYYVHVDDSGKVLRVSVEEEDGRGARSVLVTQLFNIKPAQPFPAHTVTSTPIVSASCLHELQRQSKKNHKCLSNKLVITALNENFELFVVIFSENFCFRLTTISKK